MNPSEQIKYWFDSSEEDLKAAASLLEKGHFRHCLFFAHLALEKALKAQVVRSTQNHPPRIHNLIRLSELGRLTLSESQRSFLNEFDAFQMEGRYPDSVPAPLDRVIAQGEFELAREMWQWLRNQS